MAEARPLSVKKNDRTDNICVIYNEESDFVLVQSFPQSITQNMIKNANRAGIILETMLIGLFAVYIVMLIVQERREKKNLAHQNREMGYVIGGISTLFSRFVMIDLEKDTYEYLVGTSPERSEFARSGTYKDFIGYLSSFLLKEEEKE